MDLITIKELYKLLTTSDNIFDVRGKLHHACDKVDFDMLSKKYLASENVIRMINYIKKEYNAMIEAEKTIYKISDEELKTRINKLKKVDEIFNKYSNQYIRFDKVKQLFKNPGIMHKSYILLIRYGKDDPKLDEIRPLLRNFNTYYYEFRDNFKNDIHKTVANAYEDDNNAKRLMYAKFIINEYNNEESFMFNDFLDNYGIDKKTFDDLLEMVRKNDNSLYYEFIIKSNSNEKINNNIYTYIIDDLSYAITNGEFIYGNNFDDLEFIKMIPFKDEESFITKIDDFMAIHNIYSRDIIIKYIKEHHLDSKDAFVLLDPDEVRNRKAIINNTTFSEGQMNIIVDYF